MKKLSIGFIGMVMLLLASCSNDQEFDSKPDVARTETKIMTRATTSGLGVDKEVIYLVDDSTRLAGQVVISANTPEVTLQWNLPTLCNVNTKTTQIEMVNGQATLNINWDKIQANGRYAPLSTAFNGGVLISDGTSSIYVYLIFSEIHVAELENRILSRTAVEAGVMPRAAVMAARPSTVNMTEYNGGTTRLTLTGIDYTYFGYEKIGSFTNILFNEDNLPEFIEGDATRNLFFRWKGGYNAPPANNFRVPFYIVAEAEGLSATAWVQYVKAEEEELTVTPVEFNVSALGGTATTTITTNADTWKIATQNIPDWITPSAMQGSKGTSSLTFTVTKNTTNQNRIFTIFVETGSGSKSQGIVITQLGIIPALTVTPQSFVDLSALGTVATVNVASNTDWSITSQMPDWITPNIQNGTENGTINFTIAPNAAQQGRTFTAIISTGGVGAINQEITFTQNQAAPNELTITINPDQLGYQGGNSAVTVTSNSNWVVTSNVAWATVINGTGTGNGQATITVQENTGKTSRTAVITVATTAGEPAITRTVNIIQKPRTTDINPGGGVAGSITIDDFQDTNVDIDGGGIK